MLTHAVLLGQADHLERWATMIVTILTQVEIESAALSQTKIVEVVIDTTAEDQAAGGIVTRTTKTTTAENQAGGMTTRTTKTTTAAREPVVIDPETTTGGATETETEIGTDGEMTKVTDIESIGTRRSEKEDTLLTSIAEIAAPGDERRLALRAKLEYRCDVVWLLKIRNNDYITVHHRAAMNRLIDSSVTARQGKPKFLSAMIWFRVTAYRSIRERH